MGSATDTCTLTPTALSPATTRRLVEPFSRSEEVLIGRSIALIVRAIALGVSDHAGFKLPQAHLIDLLRRIAYDGPVSVEEPEPELASRERLGLFSAPASDFPKSSSSTPNSAAPMIA